MREGHQTGIAVACSLCAMALFGLIDNFMRLAAETGSLWQFHLLRSVVALGLLFGFAAVMRLRLRIKRPGRVVLRTLFSGTAMVIYFGCLGVMPIAQAVAGLFTAPIFVVIFSVLIWKEPVGARRIFAVCLGFIGILLVLRPDAQGVGATTVLPLMAGAFHALGNLTTRKWCADEATLTLLAGFFVMMFLVGAAGMVVLGVAVTDAPAGADGFVFRSWTPVEGAFLWVTVVQGAGSLIGVGLVLRSYQLAEPSVIAVFENALLVFATLWAIALWDEVPDQIAVTGLVCIVLAGVIIAARTGRAAPRPA